MGSHYDCIVIERSLTVVRRGLPVSDMGQFMGANCVDQKGMPLYSSRYPRVAYGWEN